MNDYIRVKEAAQKLAISPETLRQYAANGKLEGQVRFRTKVVTVAIIKEILKR